MAFEISRTFVVQAPAGKVWAFLIDPANVARCLPGAQITARVDERTWSGTMAVKVGPVSSTYKGKVVFDTLDAQALRANIVATGQDTRGKGSADLRLTSALKELGPSTTEVTTTSRVNIAGILAQMGRGMIEDVTEQIFRVFAERMRGELEAKSAPPPDVPPAPGPVQEAQPALPPPPPPAAGALDLGSIGTRAALRSPVVWVAVAGVILLVIFILRR